MQLKSIQNLKFQNIFIIVISISIFVFWWCNIDFIGLHGDEANFGLRGIEYLKQGITSPYGMNKYSGIFQNLANFIAFKYFGIGVVQMRIPGIMFNTFSILILFYFFYKLNKIKEFAVFLLLFGQSAVYLNFPKIAWEINSFNFFFLTMCIVSIFNINSSKQNKLWIYIFLMFSYLSTYNHIIFLSLIVASFTGFFCWATITKNENQLFGNKIFSSLIISIGNTVILFIFIRFFVDSLWLQFKELVFIIPFILFTFEILIFDKIVLLVDFLLKILLKIKISKYISIGFLALSIVSFSKFHGITFVQILIQKIVFIRIYSYELPEIFEIILIISGGILGLFIFYTLIIGLIKNPTQPFAFIIISYLGIFCLFTRGFSIRYYYILNLIIYLYLAYYLINSNIKFKKIFLIVLVINLLLVQSILWNITSDKTKIIKGKLFAIGNNKVETSMHFLPFEPVLKFVEKNKIGQIETKENYFIGYNFRFYKFVYPHINKYQNLMKIEYNYDHFNSSFILERVYQTKSKHHI
jgi:hypothetical protein